MNQVKDNIMQDVKPENLPLRALKIIRKSYKNNRSDPQARERLQQINKIIEAKERRYSVPKKVKLSSKIKGKCGDWEGLEKQNLWK